MKLFFLVPIAIASLFPSPSNSQPMPDVSTANTLNIGNLDGLESQSTLVSQVIAPGQEASTFFETGRLQSEDRLRFQRLPAELPPIPEQSSGWRFIISQQGKCSFWLPPGIISDESVTLKTTVGDIPFRAIVTHADDHRFLIAYATSLSLEQIQSPDKLLDALRDRIAPADRFKLSNNRPITLEGHAGKELRFVGQEENIVVRAYLANNHAYVVGVIYPNANPQPQRTRAFLNAFELTNP
jgi:hypothetical protein